MTLKAVKDVLAMVAKMECADGVTDAPCAHCTAIDGREEIAAVERAAVGLYEHGLIDEGVTEGAEEATATMRRIAEESTS